MSDDEAPEITSVQVKLDTWEVLNNMKRPGDSMDDVLKRVLSDEFEDESGNSSVARASS